MSTGLASTTVGLWILFPLVAIVGVMETANNSQNVPRGTFERISDLAEQLLSALKELNPETGILPSYGNPFPKGWDIDEARPWDDTTIANLAHDLAGVRLRDGWDEPEEGEE